MELLLVFDVVFVAFAPDADADVVVVVVGAAEF